MHSLVRKLHMYAGLVSFSILIVFGIAGLTATFEEAPGKRSRPEPVVEMRDFTAPAGLDDQAMADRVHQFLQLPLTTPVPKFAIKRDANNDLALDFYTVNGPRHAVVLEKENKIRLETRRNSLARYFTGLHELNINARATDWRIRAWTWYNEFSIWALIFMSVSGLYLWLATRPFFGPARWTFAIGTGIFVVLYIWSR